MRHRTATPDADLLEKDWQATVTDLAKQLGWLVYHTFNSRRSTHGFPDLVLVRDRVVYVECKREDRTTSKLTDEQRRWLRALDQAGEEVYVARPSHVRHLSQVLALRHPVPARLKEAAEPLVDELDRELGRSEAA